MKRRNFIRAAALSSLYPLSCSRPPQFNLGEWVNDIHSKLNATLVSEIKTPQSLSQLTEHVRQASRSLHSISICGGRHAMGTQQFGSATTLLDTRKLGRVLRFDQQKGLIEVEAGIQWPSLMNYLLQAQADENHQWGIIQKQTGANRLSIGGAVSANIHGRGLALQPFSHDLESLKILNSKGDLLDVSRREHCDLFRLVVGGYGLFSVIYSVTLRLMERQKLMRNVTLVDLEDLALLHTERVNNGHLYGDCQFNIDESSSGFMKQGILSTYVPVPNDTPMPAGQKRLNADDWKSLYQLAHTHKSAAFKAYSKFYLATDGQLYWSDTHQLSTYIDDYHSALNLPNKGSNPSSEMITELYVPKTQLSRLMDTIRKDFLEHKVNLIYGTIRWIERDEDSFLPWATQSFACLVLNLHIDHSSQGIQHAKDTFRRIINYAINLGGNYYLTYHRWASREQVLTCYPQLPEFLRLKRNYDPNEIFQSDWYRFYKAMFSG